jgi:hypothetical protein
MSNEQVITEMRLSIRKMEDLLREYEECKSEPKEVPVSKLLPGMVLVTGIKILSKPIFLDRMYWSLALWPDARPIKLEWSWDAREKVVGYKPARDLPLITVLESPVWVTADKRRLYPAEFTDSHLMATIEWLAIHPKLYVDQEAAMLDRLGKSISVRSLGRWPAVELVKNSSLYRSLVAEAESRGLVR